MRPQNGPHPQGLGEVHSGRSVGLAQEGRHVSVGPSLNEGCFHGVGQHRGVWVCFQQLWQCPSGIKVAVGHCGHRGLGGEWVRLGWAGLWVEQRC